MVVRPCRVGRRLSDLPDEGRLPREARAIRRRRRYDLPHRFPAQGPAHHAGYRGPGADRHQFRSREEERDRRRSLGDGVAQEQRCRRRCLPRRQMDAGYRADLSALRRLEIGTVAQDATRHLAHRAVGRQSPRPARARRCRYLRRPAAQGRRRAGGKQEAGGDRHADRERDAVYRHAGDQAAFR